MKNLLYLFITFSFCFLFASYAEAKNSLPMAELLQQGKVVYEKHCIGCHGAKGDGEGPGAYGLFPKPRDFRGAIFKFRTTPSGALPTDEDLFRTVRQGVYGTSMPPFKLMPAPDVLAVVQYIKTFSPKWKKQKSIPRVEAISPVPSWFRRAKKREAKAAEGEELYKQYCLACHGASGKGDGFAMKNLKDQWGQKIKPADLRKSFIKSGGSLTDIYKVLVTGVSGTPMPSYKDATTEEQLWSMIAYIDQLRREYQEEKKRER